VAAMDALEEVGCDYLLHSRVVGALTEGERVTGVTLATKTGLQPVRAQVVVDASGDADVAYLAGAETLKGRPEDGFLSPMTLCLLIANVDVPAARAFNQADPGLFGFLARAKNRYPLLPDKMQFELGPFPLRNCLVVNHAGTKALGVLDGTEPRDLTRAERFSRQQALQIVAALREFGGPAFARVQLAGVGPQVGVRETRRVLGEYVLTEEDAMSGRRFQDAVAWRSGMLDIGFVRYEPMAVHDVPYGALLPQRLDHLLVAGRCISASHVAASAGKSMGNCVATGHAAGLAAALSAAQGCRPRDLDVGVLQDRLRADGVPLPYLQ
jgi:hypothetical protein